MNIPLDATAQLPQEQQKALLKAIEQLQIRDSMRLYNNLVERCFNHCVESFRSKSLDAAEEKCIKNCCAKFLSHSARVGVRFGEINAEMEKEQMKKLQNQIN